MVNACGCFVTSWADIHSSRLENLPIMEELKNVDWIPLIGAVRWIAGGPKRWTNPNYDDVWIFWHFVWIISLSFDIPVLLIKFGYIKIR